MPFFFIDKSRVNTPTPKLWNSHGLPSVAEVTASSESTEYTKQQYDDQLQRQAKSFALGQDDFSLDGKSGDHLTAKDIMSSPVVSLNEHDPLKKALMLLAPHNFRHLPVLSKSGDLMGVFSERDIIRWMDRNPDKSWKDFYETPVSQIMIGSVLTVTENMPVKELIQLMRNKSVGALPVIHNTPYDAGPKLVGMITKTDLYQLLIGPA